MFQVVIAVKRVLCFGDKVEVDKSGGWVSVQLWVSHGNPVVLNQYRHGQP